MKFLYPWEDAEESKPQVYSNFDRWLFEIGAWTALLVFLTLLWVIMAGFLIPWGG